MKPTFFENSSQFRKWLIKNHDKESELLVGFYKVNSGKLNMTWPDSVDVALCFGWIDGVRKSIDDASYQIRFTKRKPNSIWSAVNIKKVEELNKKGLMQPPGLAAFEKRKEQKSKIYSYEKEATKFSDEFLKILKSHKKAWNYFNSLAPSYQKVSTHWVMSAKQDSTKTKRLNELIRDSEAGTNQWKDNQYTKK